MSDEVKLAAGMPAPGFRLPGRSGKTISLADFAGKSDVLLYFYPKDDTPGCTKEACSLRDGWAALKAAGIVVLGVSRDGAESHEKFAKKYELPFELLTDADHAVHEAYGAWGRKMWGIGPLRRSYLIGRDGLVRHVFGKVDTENHADQVLRVAAPERASAPAPAPRKAAPRKKAAPKKPAAKKAAARKKAPKA